MFEHLAEHSRIVVTGPQRSGTTIAARMIASDSGHGFVDEAAFNVYDVAMFRSALADPGVVVQCPHMLKLLVDDPPQDVLIVLMRRSLEEIRRSEERISWTWGHKELKLFGLSEGNPAAIKYAYWDANPPSNSIEVEYESLAEHPAFVDQSQRIRFTPKQTSVDTYRPLLLSQVYPLG